MGRRYDGEIRVAHCERGGENPHLLASENAPRQPGFDGELMAASRWSYALIQRAKCQYPKNRRLPG